MATRLESFDWTAGRPGTGYDYDTLLNGEVWKCFPGEDFQKSSQSFAQTMYSAARRRGLRCHCKVEPDGAVVVQAYEFAPAQQSA